MPAALPFSLERTLTIALASGQNVKQSGVPFRCGRMLGFNDTSADRGADSAQNLQLDSSVGQATGLLAVESMVLCKPAHVAVDASSGLLLTYVLRHSVGGLRWR